jgi:coenzyme PQQ synthesis protein D (PqqD)
MALKRKFKLDRANALDAVPIRNQLCTQEETEDGLIQLSVPVRQTLYTKIMKRLTQVPKFKKIELDEIGTFVWTQCNGRNNVRALIKKLCKRYKLSQREGEVSMTQYLQSLAQRNLIGLAVDGAVIRKK